MGWLGTLGKIGLGVGAGLAAPFTGGASLMSIPALIGGAAGGLGAVSSGAAKGSADQRLKEQQGLLQQQQLAQQGARDQYSTGLDTAKFQREGQDRQQKQAILMQLLNNTQDQSITPGNPAIAGRMPQVTGGARPSNLTGNREALMALLQAPQVGAPQYQAPPSFTLPQAGKGEKMLGGIGLGSSLLGSLGPLLEGLGSPRPPQLGNLNSILDQLGRA